MKLLRIISRVYNKKNDTEYFIARVVQFPEISAIDYTKEKTIEKLNKNIRKYIKIKHILDDKFDDYMEHYVEQIDVTIN